MQELFSVSPPPAPPPPARALKKVEIRRFGMYEIASRVVHVHRCTASTVVLTEYRILNFQQGMFTRTLCCAVCVDGARKVQSNAVKQAVKEDGD